MSDILGISDEDLALGKRRLAVIRPLAENNICSQEAVAEAAKELQLSKRHIYKLIRNYHKAEGTLISLIPQRPDGGKGKSRLSLTQESIIEQSLELLYLNSQKLRPAKIMEEIRRQSLELSITAPSEATIRRRIAGLSYLKLQKREEGDIKQEVIRGCFPKVDYPLSIVQIDHTLVDIILVDPIDRLPIGRPYLTVAIDVYSRCIAGFVLSLEAPSATSVGLCLTHVAAEKGSWLAELGIDASWPIYGKPETVYVDNGTEFHSAALTRGCAQHGIELSYRPLGKPHYGGIIERVIGTLMELVHTLPGTTFSNVQKRGSYPSDKKACLTLAELEHWLVISITKYYHMKIHKGINEIPIKRYEAGLELMKLTGKALYAIQNKHTFLIDFLPIYYRKLRRDGFMLDHIAYYNNALSPLISEREKYNKFLIRRDPRDLSRIYVSLPENQGYLEVHYNKLSHPAISLFEHRFALKRIKDAGQQQVNEPAIFKAIEEARAVVKKASSATHSARRTKARLHENSKAQPQKILNHTKSKDADQPLTAYTNIEVWE